MRMRTVFVLLVLIAGFGASAQKQNDALASFERQHGRGWVVRSSGGRVTSLLGRTARSYQGKPAEAAREFLRENAALLGLRPDLGDLNVLVERTHLGGASVELQQIYESLSVENARLQVNFDKEGRVLQVTSSYVPQPAPPPPATLTQQVAERTAIAAFLEKQPKQNAEPKLAAPPKIGDVFFAVGPSLVRAYKIDIASDVPFGIMQFVIDARTGAVLRTRNFVNDVDGTGQVFNPNPRASLNDSTITDTTVPTTNPNPYFTVTLLNLDPASGGDFHLQGPFVSVEDITGPSNAVAAEALASDFVYNRGGTDFGDVMVYYHIDRIQRYIQSLGFVDVNNRRIRVDSHGESGHNAHSVNTPAGAGYLQFGDFGARFVAEDADILLHEYGHAIQANQTVDKYASYDAPAAMGEGFGDYLGASGTFAEVTAAGGDTAMVGEWAWDPFLRMVDNAKTMDDFVVGGDEHANGEIWSRGLWDIFAALGKTTTDRLVLQSHFNVPDSPTFKDGADGVMTADLQLYGGSHLPQLCTEFIARKIYVAADCPSVPSVTGTQNTLVVLARFSDVTTSPITAANVTTRIADINTYLNEITYGGASLGSATTLGWIDLPGTRASYYDQTNKSLLIDLVDDVIDELPGTDFAPFDRMIVITNDDGSGGETRGLREWATTGPWPYTRPGAFGTKRMSVSVHRFDQDQAQFNHAIGHHFGLIDLYPHESITFPRKYANDWSNMARNAADTAFPNTHVFAWEKNRPPWTTGTNVRWVPYPGAATTVTEDIPLYAQETNAKSPIAIKIGTTPGATQDNERVAYWVEARKKAGTFDTNVPSDGVLVYYVNEWIGQGFGPARIVDASPGDDDLADAAMQSTGNSIADIDGSGLTVSLIAPVSDEDYRIHVVFTPSPQNDVWINPHDQWWNSPDIWIDNDSCKAGVCGFDGVGNPREAADRGDNPIAERTNRVYARVYNHGSGTAHDVRVDFWFSDPYHAADGGDIDPDTGSNIAFNKHAFVVIPDLLPTDDGQPVFVDWTPDPVPAGQAPHSCVKVRIQPVTNDRDAFNQASQENIQEYDIASGSPYPAVTDAFKVVNPYDRGLLVFLRADNVPAGWTATVSPTKAWVPVGGAVDAIMTIQAPLTYPVCTSEKITATAWYASGDTLVPLGGTTADVHLTKNTEVTTTTKAGCTRGFQKGHAATSGQVCGIATTGCTNPARPNEHITIRYTAPDGSTVFHDVVTDANGCFEDFFVTPQGGPWQVDAEYQGGDCTKPSHGKPSVVFVPPGGGRGFGGAGNLLYSFHLGMSFPLGSFADVYDPGPSLTLDLEYPFRDRWSILYFAGYHQFAGDGGPDLGVVNFNVNLKHYFPVGSLTGFTEIGPGVYRAAGNTDWGANAGMGLHFDVLPNLAVETTTDFHFVNMKPRVMFIDARLGIVWRF